MPDDSIVSVPHATEPDPAQRADRLVVVGNGMVGHRLVEELERAEALVQWDITVLGDESRPAYDRVALSSYFDGTTADDLALGTVEWYAERGVALVLGDGAVSVDRDAHLVTTASGNTYAYDHLVLATGSAPFVPPIEGRDLAGCFVYRTIDDLDAIRSHAQRDDVRRGTVIGGGLLGLEAANALRLLGLDTSVVEFAPRLMPLQLCTGGASALQARVAQLDVSVHVAAAATSCVPNPLGTAVGALTFADGRTIDTDLVVFSAGIRPRDALARESGLATHDRGGITVDLRCVTSDPAISAIGECAHIAGRTWGLVAPGYDMARVVADRLSGGESRSFEGGDLSTKLKLLGIDVASFGAADPATAGEDTREVVWADASQDVYRRLVLSADGARILGGVLVGDASGHAELVAIAKGQMPAPAEARLLVLPEEARSGGPATHTAIPPEALVCSCNNVTAGRICEAIIGDQLRDLGAVKRVTTAGTGCGGCTPLVKRLLDDELRKAGKTVSERLCEHFTHSRVQLFDIVRALRITSFADLVASHGTGSGCEICKPAVAAMFASLGQGYILEGEQASLQDTNDHFLANIQKDGTYSVVPRVPGGEITPAQLIVIGQVAQDFGLYTKITGGQRIDLFGARVEELPVIWQRLVDAGMESGHAYGKALRTVKSCVGDTWCRFGVQDSTSLAIALEQRYRGLRAPHKMKMAVSGCVRECAEAQSKDVGVIATERGWNLWVGGNGGMRPRHAELLGEDLDVETLIRQIDRFLGFYIRTADRLERTATWLDKRPGGIAELRRIICDDELGIADELEAMIEHHSRTYECEWKATLDQPERLNRFRTFVNTDTPDPLVVMVPQRGQSRPATADERRSPTLVQIGARR